jgi:hypothetical protein
VATLKVVLDASRALDTMIPVIGDPLLLTLIGRHSTRRLTDPSSLFSFDSETAKEKGGIQCLN